MMSHGKYAKNHRLQRTSTPPNLSIAPRAVMDAAPAMIILSKTPAVYVMMRNMPRPMLLPGPIPNASIRPKATAAMITTRAMPDGMIRG